jgi:hypothetical protein
VLLYLKRLFGVKEPAFERRARRDGEIRCRFTLSLIQRRAYWQAGRASTTPPPCTTHCIHFLTSSAQLTSVYSLATKEYFRKCHFLVSQMPALVKGLQRSGGSIQGRVLLQARAKAYGVKAEELESNCLMSRRVSPIITFA